MTNTYIISYLNSLDSKTIINYMDTKLSFPLACILSFLYVVSILYSLILNVRENDSDGVFSCIWGLISSPFVVLFILWIGEIGIGNFITYAFYAIMIFIIIIIILFLGIL